MTFHAVLLEQRADVTVKAGDLDVGTPPGRTPGQNGQNGSTGPKSHLGILWGGRPTAVNETTLCRNLSVNSFPNRRRIPPGRTTG